MNTLNIGKFGMAGAKCRAVSDVPRPHLVLTFFRWLEATQERRGRVVKTARGGGAVGKQINLDPLAREVRFFGLLDGRNSESADGKRLLDPNGPRSFLEGLCKPFKKWRGRRDSNSRPLP
jgi:hypothetical protein